MGSRAGALRAVERVMEITIKLTSLAQLRALENAIDMYADMAKEGRMDKDSGFTSADYDAAKQIQALLSGKARS